MINGCGSLELRLSVYGEQMERTNDNVPTEAFDEAAEGEDWYGISEEACTRGFDSTDARPPAAAWSAVAGGRVELLPINEMAHELLRALTGKQSAPLTPEKFWMKNLSPSELHQASETLRSAFSMKDPKREHLADLCDKLVRQLDSDDPARRELAKKQLEKVGPAALPSLIQAMSSDDSHMRREAQMLALPLLRPARRLLEQQAALARLANEEELLLERSLSSTELAKRRLELRRPLLHMPDTISPEESAALLRVNTLILSMEKRMQASGAPSKNEKSAIGLCKREIRDQQIFANLLNYKVMNLLTVSIGLLADNSNNQNGIEVHETSKLLKRAFSIGAPGFEPNVLKALRKIVDRHGDRTPADLIKAFKKSGGFIELLTDPEYTQ